MTRRLSIGLRVALPVVAGLLLLAPSGLAARQLRFLDTHLLVTWYGNPHSARMGILGEASGQARADALRRQANAYAPVTPRKIVPAYHLVATVAQPTAGRGGHYRRRESRDIIDRLLAEARQHGFALVLDVQLGHAPIGPELEYLQPYLAEPDVHLALDPEFRMQDGEVPGRRIGSMPASDVNAALDFLERLVHAEDIPPKVLIVHQFTLGMLPDKRNIRRSPNVELVLMMDGFGSQDLKRSSYRAVMRQQELDFAGIKMFYRQDTNLFTPGQVLALEPLPSVVIYQ